MKILISQNRPINLSAYSVLQQKYGAEIDFRPFYVIETLSEKEFRAQKINLPDYTAIVFSSRFAIDAYFQLCEKMRFKVPETMKYFCTTEMVAMYLQKHIVYRKRKIFYGTGTTESLVALIGPKHKGEKFLIAAAEGSDIASMTSFFDAAKLDYKTGVLVKPVPQDLHDLNLGAYDFIVLYNKSDVKSLYENFPSYQRGDTKIVSFGKSIVKALDDAGLNIAIKAPTPEAPSAAKAIENYLSSKQ